jgi:ribonuclease Y
MDPIIITVIAAVAALLIGLFIGKVLFNKNTQKLVEEAEQQQIEYSKTPKIRPKHSKKRRYLRLKSTFYNLNQSTKKQCCNAIRKINDGENRIKQKEKELNDKTQLAQKQVQDYNLKEINP